MSRFWTVKSLGLNVGVGEVEDIAYLDKSSHIKSCSYNDSLINNIMTVLKELVLFKLTINIVIECLRNIRLASISHPFDVRYLHTQKHDHVYRRVFAMSFLKCFRIAINVDVIVSHAVLRCVDHVKHRPCVLYQLLKQVKHV